MAPIQLLAIITPKPDRLARSEELAREMVKHIEATEPNTLKYQYFKSGTPEEPKIVVWEVFADAAALKAHQDSPKLAWLIEREKEESNFAKPLEVLTLEHFAGFDAREDSKN
ncbi:hypothetical protein QBC43DRAFT_320737 [Cladorrhinum sp. PSN259]|nr:hypothetical protein QBC43DRAFT_320737 [Cladorrhinum sp. PSN259]